MCQNNILSSCCSYKFFQSDTVSYSLSQRPRTDLNKWFLPRPKTTTALKLIPIGLKAPGNEIPHLEFHYIEFSKTDFYHNKKSTFKLKVS